MLSWAGQRGIDHLRLPSALDPSAPLLKDWLHLNLFDHRSGSVGLVNASLHGDPAHPAAVAVGCALLHHPEEGWAGGAEVQPARAGRIDLAGLGLRSVGFALDEGGDVEVSVARPDITAALTAQARERPIVVEDRVPFGSGWLSWRAVPRLEARGRLRAFGRDHDLSGFSCYHDHNWGRWRWGDDAGWEWGAWLAPRPGPAFVLSRPTNRSHTSGLARLSVHRGARQWRFSGPAVATRRSGRWEAGILRVPGAMAALRADRRRPDLPRQVEVSFQDGYDHGRITFEVTGAAQIICAEPMAAGVTFIHELCGVARWQISLGGVVEAGEALGVVEYAG